MKMNNKIIISLILLGLMCVVNSQEEAKEDSQEDCECPKCPGEDLQLFSYILIGISALAIFYSYRLSTAKTGLDSKIDRNKKILMRQKEELKANKGKLKKQIGIMTSRQEKKMLEEIEKSKAITGMRKPRHDVLQKAYWDKIGKISETKVREGDTMELEKLEDEHSEIKKMIELTKSKYYKRVIDEGTFNEITKDYQKKLIELESKIAKLKVEEKDD